MINETVVIKKSDLRAILEDVSPIIQKTAEAAGTIEIVRDVLDDLEAATGVQALQNAVLALRNAYRNVESATNDAGAIQDAIEIAMREGVTQ